MTPPEFLLTSLATCAGYYAAQYLNTRHLRADDLIVRVRAEKLPQPARLGSFFIEVEVPGLEAFQFDASQVEHHKDGLLRAVRSCLIHNTLLAGPKIEIDVHVPGAPQAQAA
jgi:uncharacterized OsmC-like protein